jgi:drug/metabolite transporter (DMT)-like permease
MGLESLRMRDILQVLLAIALLAVAATLAMGFYSLFRGGQFGRTWSNRLMRLRVALQFTAILILAAVFWLNQNHH